MTVPDALIAFSGALAALNIAVVVHYERRMRRVEARKHAGRRVRRALHDLAARVALCEVRLDALDRRARGLDAPPARTGKRRGA